MRSVKISKNDIVLLGMPFDDYSSHLKGAAEGASVIRRMLSEGSANSSTELGKDLKADVNIVDAGDIDCSDSVDGFHSLEAAIDDIAEKYAKPLTIGGDHSITFPIVKALANHHPNLTILHFDAHPDLYDIFKGNKLSHACPFARIMENGLASRLIQVGIRTLNQHQREQADKFDVEIHEMRNWQGPSQLNITGPLYVTIDIDAIDPAFAPGVSHLEPGGLSVRQIIEVLHNINVPIIGADIVEYNPSRDLNDMTAMVAIKLYKEICGKMIES